MNLSITYKALQSQQPSYLHSRLSLQTNNSTRSSSLIILSRPANSSRLKVTNRSFSHHAPLLLFYGTIYHEKCGCRHSLLPLSPLIHLFFLCHLLNSTLVLKPTFSIILILLLNSSSGIRPGSG